ncbi:hypothetical protein Ep4_049 [Pseudomonas phage Ep4]|uniref:Uncharacterized protein n=1 Tax=Pseudomonas phage Ep4 TaxID=3057492 RepID=A0AAU9E6Y4_9CAUD|nr:hypothetical protein Ep4_049 [Pseudomonas phage Ep4]
MAIAYSTAAQVLACQVVRDIANQVERDFQQVSQSNSRPTRTVAQMQASVTALVNALADAGATVTHA